MEGLRLGYACVNTRLPSPARTTRLANATPGRLRELLVQNLDALEAILRWNAEHDVRVFRLSSNIVPLASHPVNDLPWWEELAERFAELGELVRAEELRLSTHPGQYTVLGSPSASVTEAALAELEYHATMLAAFGLDASHKIVLHLGGAYGDAGAAIERFARAAARLSVGARSRLVLENDERWSLAEVLRVGGRLGLPVVFDAFHHELAPSLRELDVRALALRAAETWSEADGRPEVHFSTQAPGRRAGAHADTLDLAAFARFAAAVEDLPLDCVLEVKDKQESVLAARRLLAAGTRVR
ncbi:MAG TPA: UV DNA damage repair endonuclease UvsE [Gaiellaceae bacterium]|nr:UV DNA damage repair endonuclease UvsE [Gaiellaceae bacterium]